IAWKVWGCKPTTSPGPRHNVTPLSALTSPETGRSFLRKSTSDHSPAKMIKMTLTVVLVYSLCWLPFNLLLVVLDFVEDVEYWPHFHHLWFVFHWLAMSHTCYNPVILCWMNTKFREGYLNVLYRLLPCCRPRLSRYLLKLHQSSGLQRAHTYSTAFGSSRSSRNQRFCDEPRKRRESSCSTTGYLQVTAATDVSLKLIRTCSLSPSADGLGYKETDMGPSDGNIVQNGNNHNPTAATICDTRSQPRMSYLDLPHDKIDRYLEMSGESTL
ncbi:RYamide receptor-like 3, partial [Homarus americanus]